jgi:hypothetical protein
MQNPDDLGEDIGDAFNELASPQSAEIAESEVEERAIRDHFALIDPSALVFTVVLIPESAALKKRGFGPTQHYKSIDELVPIIRNGSDAGFACHLAVNETDSSGGRKTPVQRRRSRCHRAS